MDALLQKFDNAQVIAVLLAIAGLLLIIVGAARRVNFMGADISVVGAARVVCVIFGIVLLGPAARIGYQVTVEPTSPKAQQVNTAETGCILPLQIVSRGVPVRVGSQWLFAGGTTTSVIPQSGAFYLIGGSQKEPLAVPYLKDIPVAFEVDGTKLWFKASEVENAWVRAEIKQDQKDCP